MKINCSDRLLIVEDICKLLGVCKVTVYNHIKYRGMPAKKIGKRYLFSQDEVNKWISMQ